MLSGVYLEHTPGRALASYHNVDHALHTMLDQQVGDLEPVFRVGVGGNHRLILSERVTARRLFMSSERGVADNAGLPVDACPNQKRVAIRLQFEHLDQIDSDAL